MLMKEQWERNEIDTLPRPVQNADRSQIEHIARPVKLRVRQMDPKNHESLCHLSRGLYQNNDVIKNFGKHFQEDITRKLSF